MRVVLDTNVLAVAVSRRSRYYPIWQSLRQGEFDLLITTDILFEYDEIIGHHLSPQVAANIVGGLELLPNTIYVNKYFFWNLIDPDPDDNKFVDCAIAGAADFIVTNDNHFKILKKIPFPSIAVLNSDEFLEMVIQGGL